MELLESLPPTSKRVEQHTEPGLNEAIRRRSDEEVARLQYAQSQEIAEHLRQLDEAWDVERVLQANASLLCLAGIALGARVDKRFLLLPAAVFSFFGQHALQGWCPPLPVLRRLGIRTVREIERERYAVKALRGDFDKVPRQEEAPARERARAALAAVDL
jgi:hypothetical protein